MSRRLVRRGDPRLRPDTGRLSRRRALGSLAGVSAAATVPAALLQRPAEASDAAVGAVAESMPASASEPISGESRADPPPRPEYLKRTRDPDTGRDVVRVVDDPGTPVRGQQSLWGELARHAYSKVPVWDADGGLAVVRNAGAAKGDGSGAWEWTLLDGRSYVPVGLVRRRFTEFRWFHTRPGRALLVTPEGLVDYAPLDREETELPGSRRLAREYEALSLANEGNLSRDDAVLVLLGTRRRDGRRQAIVWSLERDELISRVDLEHPRVDFATVSPLGGHVVVNGELEAGLADRSRVMRLDGTPVGSDWEPYGSPSHYDLTLDGAGREIAVGIAKTAHGDVPAGSVIARALSDGTETVLLEGGYPSHVSCRNVRLPGWCFVSCTGTPSGYPRFGDELLAVATDGSREFRRLARFHRTGDGYASQPQACPDPWGSRAMFASDWGDLAGPVQAFVVEIGLAPVPRL